MKKLILVCSILFSSSIACSLLPTENNRKQQSCDNLMLLMCEKIATCTPMSYQECMIKIHKGGCGESNSEMLDACAVELLDQKCTQPTPNSCELLK
jgi:hypothetical protein